MTQFEGPSVSIPDDLLRTKLVVPRSHSALIARPSLDARLSDGAARKLTLIAAPAGFGKTTLVSEWITTRRPVAWVSLDTGDNDAIRFWRYVINACRVFDPAIGKSALARLRMAQ